MKIVYEDKDVLAVIKPVGMPIQDDLSGDTSLLGSLSEKYKELGLVHRLDRQVGGLVVFAKHKAATAYMNKQIATRKVEKYYYALVEGKVDHKQDILEHRLIKNAKLKKAVLDDSGKLAKLAYEVIAEFEDTTLLRVKLFTGRFHQIRAQLSSVGNPIVNDKKYGGKIVRGKRGIGLYSCAFNFKTSKGEVRNIAINVPDIWPFA